MLLGLKGISMAGCFATTLVEEGDSEAKPLKGFWFRQETTRTLEFNADGAMRFYQAVSGSSDFQTTKHPELSFRAVLTEEGAKVHVLRA